MLKIENCCLVVVDVQGRLAELMDGRGDLFSNICILIKAAKILDIPILWCQQKPSALGATVPEIADLLVDSEPFDKLSFSCCGNEPFNTAISKLNRKQILLCGIETHVCIYQTAMDMIKAGFGVEIIADAVSSRTLQNKQIALDRLKAAGADISSTEMAIFELLETAEHPDFKAIARLIK